MNKEETLKCLKEFFDTPEVTGGFPSKQACISWANKVAPLLRFNRQYYQQFVYYSQIINHKVSNYTAEPAFRTMVSQVEMAIEELKVDISVEEKAVTQTQTSTKQADVIDIKPNLFGIGVNLNEAWRRVKDLFMRESKK